MPKLVVGTASLKCSFGNAPISFTVAPANKVSCGNQAAATVQDFAPNVNVMPFGMCQSMQNPQVASATAAAQGTLTPQPCVPVIPAPWSPGSSSVKIGGAAALTDDSKCNCAWGGSIEISAPGQQSTSLGDGAAGGKQSSAQSNKAASGGGGGRPIAAAAQMMLKVMEGATAAAKTPPAQDPGLLDVPGKEVVDKISTSLEHGSLSKVNAIVLHRTDAATAVSTLNKYDAEKDKADAAHFLVGEDGTIYQTAHVDKKTWHVGEIRARCQEENKWDKEEKKAVMALWNAKKDYGLRTKDVHRHELKKNYPDRYPVNEDSIGIEVTGSYNKKAPAFEKPTDGQLDSVKALVEALLAKFNLTLSDVFHHGKISYKDKNYTEGADLGYQHAGLDQVNKEVKGEAKKE